MTLPSSAQRACDAFAAQLAEALARDPDHSVEALRDLVAALALDAGLFDSELGPETRKAVANLRQRAGSAALTERLGAQGRKKSILATLRACAFAFAAGTTSSRVQAGARRLFGLKAPATPPARRPTGPDALLALRVSAKASRR